MGLLAPGPAWAVQKNYTTLAASSYFDIAGNWTPNGAPGGFDDARFFQIFPQTVLWDNITGNRTNASLSIEGADVTLRRAGGDTGSYTYTLQKGPGSGVVSISNGGILQLGSNGNPLNIQAYDALLSDNARYAIEAGKHTSQNWFIVDSGGTFNNVQRGAFVNGADASLDTGVLGVGLWSGFGVFQATDGASVNAASTVIGQETSVIGSASLLGSNTDWRTSTHTILGRKQDAQGALKVDAGTYTGDGHIYVGYSAGSFGRLDVKNGGRLNANGNMTISRDNAAEAFLWISDAGSEVSIRDTLNVGTNGAVRLWGDKGNLSIDSLGKMGRNNTGEIYVGVEGTGVLDLDNGRIDSTATVLADKDTSNATVTLNGANATWVNTGSFFAGRAGDGSMSVSGGASLSADSAYIGLSSASDFSTTVTGTDSEWNNTGELYVGDFGKGSLSVLAGGLVTAKNVNIGRQFGSEGGVTVSGADSALRSTQTLQVGLLGKGSLSLEAGATVSSGGARLGLFNLGQGTVQVNGGIWTNFGSLYVGGSDTASAGKGRVDVADGARVDVRGDLVVWNADSSVSTGDNTVFNINGGRIDVDGKVILRNGGKLTANQVHSGASDSFGNTLGAAGGIDVRGGKVHAWDFYTGFSFDNATTTVSESGLIDAGNKVEVGVAGIGMLNIRSGGQVNSTVGKLGTESLGAGNVLVDGAQSKWDMSELLTVGQFGTGVMTIANGGEVRNADAMLARGGSGTGTVTVNDGGQWINSGNVYVGGSNTGAAGTGKVDIKDGGRVDVGSLLKIWGDGEVDLNGSNRMLNVGSTGTTVPAFSRRMHVGVDQAGRVELVDGGVLRTRSGDIGFTTGVDGSVLVDGAGSSWDTRFISVGSAGNGSLTISDGGVVNAQDSQVAESATSISSVQVDGAGSQWNQTGRLFVGVGGEGEVSIGSGGTVGNTDAFLGWAGSGKGTVNVNDSGRWTNSGNLYVGGTGSAAAGTGKVMVNGDGRVDVGSLLKIWDKGEVDLDGTNRMLNVGSNGSASPFSGRLNVGVDAGGRVEVLGGGVLRTRIAEIAYNGGMGGSVLVDGPGSVWHNDQNMNVGFRGIGSLTISDGGVVNSRESWMATGNNSTSNVLVDGAGSAWNQAGLLVVGNRGAAELNIGNGGFVRNADALLGRIGNGNGTVNVNDGGHWVSSGNLFVGGTDTAAAGKGTVNINDGGRVDVGNLLKIWGDGEVDLNGSNRMLNVGSTGTTVPAFTSRLQVGLEHMGRVEVLGGGTLRTRIGEIGITPNIDGSVLVDGAGSTWHNTFHTNVGGPGNGTLTISSGGVVNTTESWVAGSSSSTSSVSVDGTGSQWNHTGQLVIGNSGEADVVIGNGAVVTNVDAMIARGNSARGTVNVNNDGQWVSSGNVYVGGSDTAAGGAGILKLNTGGRAESTQMLRIWEQGRVNLAGGDLQADGGVDNRGAMHVDQSGSTVSGNVNHQGALNVADGTTVVFANDLANNGSQFHVGSGATVEIQGAYSGASIISGLGTMQFSAGVNGGNSPAQVNVEGNVEFKSSSTLTLEIGGLRAGDEYDQWLVGGAARLGGALEIVLLNGFSVSPGDSFELFSAAGGLSGSFTEILLAEELSAMDYELMFGDYGFSLSIAATAVPLPLSAWLMLSALPCLAVGRRRGCRESGSHRIS